MKEKREALPIRILRRLEFVNPKYEISLNVYYSILSSLGQISIDSPEGYRQYLLRTILPNILFDKVSVSSESQ